MSQPQNNLKRVGGLPRPRVLVLGDWKAEHWDALGRLFPTCWSIGTLPKDLDHNDIDLVIAGPDSYSSSSHKYLRLCPLIMLGMAPDFEHQINFYATSLSRRIEVILPNLPSELYRLRERELFEIDNYSQWKTLTAWASKGDTRPLPLNECSILHNTEKESLGFVTDPLCSPFSRVKYRACLPWQVKYPVEWASAIFNYWAESMPDDHPFYIPWRKDPKWMTPKELEAFNELERLNKEEDAVLARINAARMRANQHFQEHHAIANNGIKKLLDSKKDKELVSITKDVLTEMGFSVQDVDEISPPGQFAEDLRLSHPDFCGEVLCEIKGFKGGAKREDLDQIRWHIAQYRRDNDKGPYRSWFIVNGQFGELPGRRYAPFHSDKEAVRSLEDNEKILVIGTCDLYRLLIDETLTQDKRRQHLLEKEGGVFRWRPPN